MLDQRRFVFSQGSVRHDMGRWHGLLGGELMLGSRRLLFSPQAAFEIRLRQMGDVLLPRSGPLGRTNQSILIL